MPCAFEFAVDTPAELYPLLPVLRLPRAELQRLAARESRAQPALPPSRTEALTAWVRPPAGAPHDLPGAPRDLHAISAEPRRVRRDRTRALGLRARPALP